MPRRQQKFFGEITEADIIRHKRNLKALKRNSVKWKPSVDVLARRLAPLTKPPPFPKRRHDHDQQVNVIVAWLAKKQNARRRDLRKLKGKALAHQRAITMLHKVVDGAALDANKLQWLKQRYAAKNPELAWAIDAVCPTAATTSRNINGEGGSSDILKVGGKSAQKLSRKRKPYNPAIDTISLTATGTSRNTRGEGWSRDILLVRENGEGLNPFKRRLLHSQFRGYWHGPDYWPITATSSLSPDHQFRPGNETVLVGCGDDPTPSLNVRGWTPSGEEIGILKPGAEKIRIGPRKLVEIQRGPATTVLVNVRGPDPMHFKDPWIARHDEPWISRGTVNPWAVYWDRHPNKLRRIKRIQYGREWAALAPWLTDTELLFNWWKVPMPATRGHFEATQQLLLKPGQKSGQWRIAGCGKTKVRTVRINN